MTYTIELNDWEAIALATMMKQKFEDNLDFLKMNEKACQAAPELEAFTNVAMKEQTLYNKVYCAIWSKRREG